MYEALIEKLIVQVPLIKFRECSGWWKEMSTSKSKPITSKSLKRSSPSAKPSSKKSWSDRLAGRWRPIWPCPSTAWKKTIRRLSEVYFWGQAMELSSATTRLIREWDLFSSNCCLRSERCCSPKKNEWLIWIIHQIWTTWIAFILLYWWTIIKFNTLLYGSFQKHILGSKNPSENILLRGDNLHLSLIFLRSGSKTSTWRYWRDLSDQ